MVKISTTSSSKINFLYIARQRKTMKFSNKYDSDGAPLKYTKVDAFDHSRNKTNIISWLFASVLVWKSVSKSYLWMALMLFILSNQSYQVYSQTLGEFHFYGLSNGATTIDSVNNSTVQNSFKTPVGMYGGTYSSNEPTLYQNGVHITHNKYIVSTGTFQDTANDNSYHTFNLWIYYMTGEMGTFMNIDIAYHSTNTSSLKLSTSMSGTDQKFDQEVSSIASSGLTSQSLVTGWNLVSLLHGCSTIFYYFTMWKYGTNWMYELFSTSTSSLYWPATPNGVNKLGWFDWADSTVEYLIYSLSFRKGAGNLGSSVYWNYAVPLNPNYGNLTSTCGNSVIDSGLETCDDRNLVNGDGCSSLWVVETGCQCTIAIPSVCTDICGNGAISISTFPADYCDDGNSVNGDGCSSTWATESGYDCTTTGLSVCSDFCGDGVTVTTPVSGYWDDGNLVDGDGCDSTCAVEVGYDCTTSDPSVCTEIWGDGMFVTTHASGYWDDGNLVDGDGCSSSWATEPGYDCTTTGPSVCSDFCGDGITVTSPVSGYCDDGNTNDGDGCSSTCVVETGYEWSGGSSSTPDACSLIWGDGLRVDSEIWDDGNLIDLDGCDSTWNIELGFLWEGGSTTTSDIWYLDNESCSSTNQEGNGWMIISSTAIITIVSLVISIHMISSIIASITTSCSTQTII